MDALVQFTLPLSGLRNGVHQFDFQIDAGFYKHFENPLVEDGIINCRLVFDKKPNLIILDFYLKGFIKAECDRCLESFNLPTDTSKRLLVKYDEIAREEEEVIYIPRELQQLNIAKYIYEFICLAVPMKKTHEDAGLECDREMLKYLKDYKKEQRSNPMWEALKKLNGDSR